jgi:hypothetical protein
MAYSLRVLSPIIRTANPPRLVLDITPDWQKPDIPLKARGWRRSTRAIGGFWQGEFTLYGDLSDLAHFFYHNLGCHVEEYSGGHKTWEGIVYEMELTTDGSTRRRSFDTLYNYVKVRYRSTDNDVLFTGTASNTASIQAYGRREQIWPVDGQDGNAAADVRDSILREFQWPTAKKAGTTLGLVGDASLFVRVCGYVFTANWRYESAGDNTDDNLSDWLSEIITTDCPFLQEGKIQSNTRQVRKETKIEMRAWDVITKLLEMGISDGSNKVPARAYVGDERRFYYEQIRTAPLYFKRKGGFYTAAGSHIEADPWQVRPAVVRDLTYPIESYEIDSWLPDARDGYMTEVEVWDNQDGTARLVPKGEEFEESDILTAQEAYKEQLRRLKAEEAK